MIKKYFLLACFLLLTETLTAQVRSVLTNMYGEVIIAIEVDNAGCVIIDTDGNILNILNMNGYPEYYSNFHDYESGKIKNIDGITFTYYSDFHDYEARKIKSIGKIGFTYYSNFHDYEGGKLKSIGNVQITYYSDFHDYESGKIKSIAGINFNYYSSFNDYEKGRIKSIGRSQYAYYSKFDYNTDLVGRLKSGPRQFTDKGISFILKDAFNRRQRKFNRNSNQWEQNEIQKYLLSY